MPNDRADGDAALSAVRPRGHALWDDWDVPPRVPAAPVLHLEGFDGPIDLLLELAERQRLDLGRISLVALVDQFVAGCAQLAPHVMIERRADWLVMATRLVLLRSRLLFPATPEAAAEANSLRRAWNLASRSSRAESSMASGVMGSLGLPNSSLP